MMKKPRKKIHKEVLCLLRRTKREMEIEEISDRTKLTKEQVRNAIKNMLKNRGMVEVKPREKLIPGKGKPPLGKSKVILKRDKNGKIPKYIDYITNEYENYKSKYNV